MLKDGSAFATNVGDEHTHIVLSIAREARDTADVNQVVVRESE
jgi:hypothetical protein